MAHDDPTRPEPKDDQLDLIKNLVNQVVELKIRVEQLESGGDFTIEIKATTGDFADADSWDTRIVLNTFDNNLKLFAENSWRTIFVY